MQLQFNVCTKLLNLRMWYNTQQNPNKISSLAMDPGKNNEQ